MKLQSPASAPEKAAEKLSKAARSSPQALKRETFSTTYGTTKVVPLPKTCMNQSYSAACEGALITRHLRHA